MYSASVYGWGVVCIQPGERQPTGRSLAPGALVLVANDQFHPSCSHIGVALDRGIIEEDVKAYAYDKMDNSERRHSERPQDFIGRNNPVFKPGTIIDV